MKQHICGDCKKNCHLKGIRIYECGDFEEEVTQEDTNKCFTTGQKHTQNCPKCGNLFSPQVGFYYGEPTICSDCQGGGDSWSSTQNNGIENSVEQTEKTRWFFNTENGVSLWHWNGRNGEWACGSDGQSVNSFLEPSHFIGWQEYIEVQERDLPYLEKPKAQSGYEWVFKKMEKGDYYCDIISGVHSHPVLASHDDYSEWLQGYRWVRVVTDLDGIPVNSSKKQHEPCTVSRQDDDIGCKEGRFVEYPVYIKGDSYFCDVLHVRFGDANTLAYLPNIVGFAGVQFEGQWQDEVWSMDLTGFLDEAGFVAFNSEGGDKSATPIKARFLVED